MLYTTLAAVTLNAKSGLFALAALCALGVIITARVVPDYWWRFAVGTTLFLMAVSWMLWAAGA